MKWQGRQRSSNIEDRRSSGGGLGGGFRGGFGGGGLGGGFGRGPGFRIPTGRSGGGLGGIGMLILIGVVLFALGINPLSLLSGGGFDTGSASVSSRPLPQAGEDELADFVGVVVKETEDVWAQKFAEAGQTYVPPKVVLFTQGTQTGCGTASAASGPFYCPNDRKVYIDLSFYQQLRREFGAPGDFAQAYVLAHEVGHHVQNLEGTLPEFNQRRMAMSAAEANAYSVRIELQADCYAGVWANSIGRENLLDEGDVEEAITAANAIGDDTLQRQTQGRVTPRNFTHGTSEQRMAWLERGMQTGDPAACDTLSGDL